MLKPIQMLAGAAVLLSLAAPAGAQVVNPRWNIKLGVSRLHLRDKLDLTAGGAAVPGAAMDTKDQYTATVQIGYFLTDNIAVNATLGIPPHVTIKGKGTIAQYGTLAKTTYGPTAFALQYHPTRSGVVQPYVGAGVSYMIDFSAKDGAFTNVHITNAVAPVIEGGAEVMISPKMGLFADVKKAWLRPSATGTFFGMPVHGKTYLDPLVFSAGVSFHF